MTGRLRVSVISSDVSNNALSRAWTLAEMLGRDFDVEIVGSALGGEMWTPARDGAIAVEAVRGRRLPLYATAAARLLRRINGDVVYAVKPLPTSLGIALLHRHRTRTPFILDIDDDELSFRPWRAGSAVDPNGRPWSGLLTRRIPSADAITVASRGLQLRHGGTFVPHARDTDHLRPRPELAARAREALGASPERKLVLFVGTPRPHKGVDDLAVAVARMRHPAQLALVGANGSDPYVRSLREAHPELLVHPPYPLRDTGFFLQAADAIGIPQRLQPESIVQTPAKLFDAMAVGKPIVATSVGDITLALADGRGHVVPPRDPDALARALDAVFDTPGEARRMGERARDWCVRHASYSAIAPVVAEVVRGASKR